MKFLIMSGTGDGLGLGIYLKDRGHQVAAWIHDKHSAHNFDGLLLKPNKWETFLDKDTVVIFDGSGGGRTGDRLRARGFAVFMGSVFADQLELDREIAFEFMRQVGIKTPHSETFGDFNSAKAFVKKNPQRWAFKVSGEFANDPHVHTYVSSDADDMIEMLNYFEEVATKKPEFELQEFKEGVAISTEGWFNGKEFMKPFNHTVERKQLMNKNLGPSGGCAGNLVWAWPQGTNHIIEEGIGLMAPILEEYGYVGPIDLNTVVNREGVWALEFTPRFGYDAFPALLEIFQGDIGEDLIAPLARGEHPKEMVLKSGYGSALRINVPPYPSDQFHHEGGVPIRGFEKEDRPHLFFYDAMLSDKNKLVTSPASGALVAITSSGETPQLAFDYPYEKAKKAKIPDKMYRTDLVDVLGKDIAEFNDILSVRTKV
jgi:phosphoribosylamine--glycine ligase